MMHFRYKVAVVVYTSVACVALSACSTSKPVQDRPVVVNRPVVVDCALERPAKPNSLPSDWDSRDVRQKSALIGQKAIQWRDYGEALEAATAGCR